MPASVPTILAGHVKAGERSALANALDLVVTSPKAPSVALQDTTTVGSVFRVLAERMVQPPFTEAAQERHIEVGVLLRVPAVAEQIDRHFQALIEAGVLNRLTENE